MKFKRLSTTLVILLLLQACAMSLNEFKQAILDDNAGGDSDQAVTRNPSSQGGFKTQAQPLPLVWRVKGDALSEAQARWPWASGNQLYRRAQILSLGPTYQELEALDKSSDAKTELEILNSIVIRSTGRYGSIHYQQ